MSRFFSEKIFIAPTIKNPDNATPSNTILNQLFRYTQEHPYLDNLKEDVGRVVNCLKYIKINLDFIAFFSAITKMILARSFYSLFL
ncbi:hypothetical protein [Coxiella-like endosymbiont]|uniref:hypothetical protein n=1 Tax=Coxiella-like endosymbiont TaxID=1592897 RepID=UPI00272D62FF|nr:hypothetical protein [Coxiella-like endosymbiont]